ncbi:rap guanine nucleotide exchange factor 6 [Silurus asotus]|uniref:Rap guanine nucleotide exchange factor 6 n=1 Tax=Silurus asotus TaxID=30991 RepID=A0AAD5F942_SILAS|nr:rap guanine nucleotide exchange factor 6 [Silurus asotus]
MACSSGMCIIPAVSKNLIERRSTKSDLSPVFTRSSLTSSKSHNRVSQVLQINPVSLYPLRKKSTTKDLMIAHSFSSPQVLKKTSVLVEQCNEKRNELTSHQSSQTVPLQGSLGKVDTSDSSHKIPSHCNIDSNCSLDCIHSTGTGLSLLRNLVTHVSNFTSTTSTEELILPLSEVSDSGRRSWTSCSSNSHDTFQNFQVQRMSQHNQRHPQKDDTIKEVDDPEAINGHFRDGSGSSQSRQSWAFSSLVSDRYEENYCTVKCSKQQNKDPAYKKVTSTTEEGLIGEGKYNKYNRWAFTDGISRFHSHFT